MTLVRLWLQHSWNWLGVAAGLLLFLFLRFVGVDGSIAHNSLSCIGWV